MGGAWEVRTEVVAPSSWLRQFEDFPAPSGYGIWSTVKTQTEKGLRTQSISGVHL